MKKVVFAGLGTAVLAATASADITGAVAVSYSATAVDFDGSSITTNIQDIYLTSNAGNDVALNVFNLIMNDSGNGTDFFQSFTGTGWQPTNLGGPFDAAALREIDSFVTIGGFAPDALQVPGAGAGTGLDPNFGGNTAIRPGNLAGWYNGSPPSLNGAMQNNGEGELQNSVLVGRFSSLSEFDLVGSSLEVTWNQGLGTPGQAAGFLVTSPIPAPGALALLGLAGFAGRRRRG